MFDMFLEKVKKVLSSRLLPIIIIYSGLFFCLVYRIFVLQIVEGGTVSEEDDVKMTEEREIKSTRGNIYDRNGVLLAYNELSYSVVIEDTSSTASISNTERNATIYKLIQLIERNNDEIDVDFPIVLDEDGNFSFNISSDTTLKRFKTTAYSYVLDDDKLTQEQSDSSAEDVFNYLRHGDTDGMTKMFDISDEYTVEEALQIMSIRYAIFSNYPKYQKITVATMVSSETVAAIKENSEELVGVDIEQDSYRVYNDSIYFSHLLGYTGKINSDELEDMTAEGYNYNNTDVIGKSGIEKVYETYLAGTKGSETVTVNYLRKVVSVDSVVDPVAGNDIYLTIDSDLQKAAYHILENKIAGILLEYIVPNLDYGTKGDSASDIKIPIYEVYYALIDNNVIDITSLNNEDSTNLEKQVYDKFKTLQKEVLNQLNDLLDPACTTTNSAAGSEMADYLDYIYRLLKSKGYILSSAINKEDDVYTGFANGNTGLSQYLQHAISNNWIDLSMLNIGNEYYSTDEIYEMLVDKIQTLLDQDSSFNKKIYRNLVFSYKLTGKEICLLLFDQGVLEYNEEDITKLENGIISGYTFLTNKIESLEITPAQLALEPCSGSIVITDPNTGDVRAMISYPSYDNNKLANKVDSDYFAQLTTDKSSPLYNRATQTKTAPGSTFKMITSIAGLNEGVISTTETIYDKVAFEKYTDQSPKCWSKVSHGNENVVHALRDSCNYFFYEVGWRLGGGNSGTFNTSLALSKLSKYASMFGFDSNSGIEITESTPQISSQDGVRSAIGQGNNAFTPSQLARYVSTLANGGTLYDLTLLNRVTDKDGNSVLEKAPVVSGDLTGISRTYWSSVLNGMYEVVNDGSIKSLFTDVNVVAAGKTGTAQQNTSSPNHALFVSFAPYSDPEIAVTCVIPNGYSSANAADVASQIYKYYYGSTNLEEIMEDGASDSSNLSSFAD